MNKTERSAPDASAVIADIKRVAKALGHPPTKHLYMHHGKFKEWQIRKLFGGFLGAMKAAGFDHFAIRISQLEAENKRLSESLEAAVEDAASTTQLRELIGMASPHSFGEIPNWLTGVRGPQRKSVTGIPTLFFSDIHFDEVVNPAQVEHVNQYNHAIAVKRIQHTFKTAMDLLLHYMANPKYDGIVVPLGGDMFSGNIHEELAETNQQRILKSVLDLTDLFIIGIGEMADAFGKVFVPCVVGNHGRMHKKPRAKNRVQDNFEWMFYQLLARHFQSDSRITFHIPDSADCQFSLYETNFLLTHGDQFKGGGGVSGVFAPLMTGMARKQKRQQSVRRAFDVMMMGHWHQYIHAQSLIINGSVKGYDEYAYQGNFAFERPQQALFITNPDRGINFRMPILCDGYEDRAVSRDQLKIWK